MAVILSFDTVESALGSCLSDSPSIFLMCYDNSVFVLSPRVIVGRYSPSDLSGVRYILANVRAIQQPTLVYRFSGFKSQLMGSMPEIAKSIITNSLWGLRCARIGGMTKVSA